MNVSDAHLPAEKPMNASELLQEIREGADAVEVASRILSQRDLSRAKCVALFLDVAVGLLPDGVSTVQYMIEHSRNRSISLGFALASQLIQRCSEHQQLARLFFDDEIRNFSLHTANIQEVDKMIQAAIFLNETECADRGIRQLLDSSEREKAFDRLASMTYVFLSVGQVDRADQLWQVLLKQYSDFDVRKRWLAFLSKKPRYYRHVLHRNQPVRSVFGRHCLLHLRSIS